ncbi:alpha/beta fold hydrolase [Rhodopseudomonas palustris]|uniref:Acylglycerol lipase n=1 Tax=Rhodopseudomonas palustris (strain DX-1) TaxID=652103 RepID=E6VEW5_RHOPX|nr:alpha/beta fold hydrolase [Rhodopseudomonas palustris]QDL99143.1 alpha/beta fold hydrolase [Rhodopseudomonas palustris]
MSEAVMAGAEAFAFDGGKTGVLLVHGFTGSPQSMRYLGERLGERGYSILGPRLPGHGVSPAAMAETTASDWVDCAEDALLELSARCDKTFVAGLSMGGTLSLYLAALHPDKVAGVIPINAAVQIDSPDLAGLAYARGLPEFVPGIGSDMVDTTTKELAYDQVPVTCVKQVMGLAATARALLPKIKCPTLVINSRVDHVLSPTNATVIASHVGSSRIELRWLDNSYHVATIDNDKDLIAAEIDGFVQRNL